MRGNPIFLTLLLATILALFARQATAQIPLDDGQGYLLSAAVIDGDTIPFIRIPAVVVVRQRVFKNERDLQAYRRMIRNLKIVYPYALHARKVFEEMDSVYQTLRTPQEREAYTKKMEKELMAQFEGSIRDLTFSQGRMLIKLIDRETGRTSYDIIRAFRGSFSAGFWQMVARLFGSNLKSRFDAQEEDRILDELIILYEHGQL